MDVKLADSGCVAGRTTVATGRLEGQAHPDIARQHRPRGGRILRAGTCLFGAAGALAALRLAGAPIGWWLATMPLWIVPAALMAGAAVLVAVLSVAFAVAWAFEAVVWAKGLLRRK